ncbi:MAG TPA: M64 family metallopeptidase [Gaiellaceae bacterium]|nr:M64 family metallopeptidase [Gaiellaceae bacterium]
MSPRTPSLSRWRATVAALAAALFIALAAPSTAGAQEPGSATVVPIQITGPPAERLNLVILGDGYTASEQQKFRDDVDRNLNVQWSVEPFRSYRHYFNVYRLEIVSQDSGISCDPDDGNVRRNTPLRLNFANNCPAGALARGITYGPALAPGGCMGLNSPGCSGSQQHNLFMSTYLAPLGVSGQNVQTLALANTFTYGGIGGTQATTSGGSPQGPLISTHELGHSLGQMADEYPYSARDVVRPCYTGGEPGSFHHTIRTSTQNMIDTQHKWWRWIGEESLSGGTIGLWEGGNTFPCGVRRPSQHSMMRWLGFSFDQVGREHMTYRITGLRNANAMALVHTPLGEVGPGDVVWVETQHPKYHELTVTWRVNGEVVPNTANGRNLELASLGVSAGDVVQVTVQDETDFVRDPGFKNGPRLTQTRQWTVGEPLAPASPAPAFTNSTPTDRAVGGDEVVFVETTHPTDRVHDVEWSLNGEVVPNGNKRNFDLGAQGLSPATYELSATVTDPADPGGASQARSWTVDSTLPEAPRTLSEPLTSLSSVVEHNVYFNEFDMRLDPADDQPGFVVGEFRLNEDGWFNYFGFPEQPHGTPFTFSYAGKDVKALTYGNLGTGGLSKATFEQFFTDAHPSGGFEPGFGTHTIEHRAIDAAGNIGDADFYKATVLPGGSPECTTTVSGDRAGRLIVGSGVTCIAGGSMNGGVTVRPGASLVVLDGSTINGGLGATGADVVHVFGARVNGDSQISGTTGDLIVAGSAFHGSLTLDGNRSADVTIPSGDTRNYGVGLVGSSVTDDLACAGNDPGVTDYGAPNSIGGAATGDCAAL